MKWLAMLALAACGDNIPPHLQYIDRPDAGADATPDACTYTPDDASSCCDLLPDQATFAACVAMPPGACGVVVCFHRDCSSDKYNVCGPMADGGS